MNGEVKAKCGFLVGTVFVQPETRGNSHSLRHYPVPQSGGAREFALFACTAIDIDG